MGLRGPAEWEPTEAERRMVEHYVSIGYTQAQIGSLMGKSVDTLQRRCRQELDNGALKVNAQIGGKLFQKAMAGDTASLIFWAKTRMGWKETQLHGSDPNNPLPSGFSIRLVRADDAPPAIEDKSGE